MRKTIVVLSWLLLIATHSLIAQNRQISGTVRNEKQEPIPGASLKVVGSTAGTSSAADGSFTITVPPNAKTLEVTAVGHAPQNVSIASISNGFVVTLKEAANSLQEVVVTTAFGFKARKKTLGYSTQEINNQELNKGKENSFINALQGKVSGVNITPSGGAPGAGTDIVIRGLSSISPTANNQPLIVIDGVPVNNSTIVGSVLPSSGTNNNQAASRDQFAFANRGLDINPDDIESISILKGAGATALYGLNAAAGAIIITTKKGSTGKMSVSLNSSAAVDFLTKFPEIQTKYREGQQGRLSFNADGSPNRFQTFGPKATASDPVYYNFRDAFDHGQRYNNGVSVQGGSAKTTYYSSFSSLNQKGIVPASSFNRYTFKLSGTQQLADNFNTFAAATFTSSNTVAASQGDKGFMTALSYYSPTFDVRDYIAADGSMKVYSPGVIDNPIYVAHFSQQKSNLSRVVGNIGFGWTILPKLKLDYKLGGDFYGDLRTRIVPGPRFPGDPTTLDLANATGGFIAEDRVTFRDVNSNLYLTYADKEGDFDYSVLVGHNLQNTYTDIVSARGERFALPGFYDLSNTANLYNTRTTIRRKYAGVFGDVKFGYKNGIFLELTGRNDWSSTLPKSNNSFFYPSASLSYVFTDLHHLSGSVLSFGKLRASYAEVGKDAPSYYNGPYFSAVAGFPFGSVPGFLQTTDYSDPNLKPEKQKSVEIGTELRFLKDRIGLDVSYYKSKNVDQIIPVPIAYTGGFSVYNTNAGTIQNQGFEVAANGDIIRSNSFRWNVNVNWSRNRSKVLAIKEGISEIVFYDEGRISNKLTVGGSAGDLYGTAYQRDAAGNVIVNAQGYPDYTRSFVKVGNAFPDWLGSVGSSITWKQFTLAFLLEYKKGGDVFDVTMRNSIRNGVLKITETRDVNVIFNGVKADGKVNDIPALIDFNFYRNANFFNNIADVILQDASWLRLRNVSVAYDFPSKIIQRARFIKGANINITASNFILWTPYKGYDPGTNAFGAGYNVYGYTGSNIPNYSSLVLSLNLNF
ncbi:MAG TPA: SusC/RagA family TonB-linked outer membrane protein [Chitinophagaceae bacterium]|nr:SusC/RagA family TonB-linked outer membrane protein [Chitinophagaceae bacterium]